MSIDLNSQDYQFLQEKAQKILQDLKNVDDNEWKKKKELIEDYVATNRKLLKANKLPIENTKDFCSFIVLNLNNRGITVNQNGVFYALFADDEKGNQGVKNRLQVEKISSDSTVSEQVSKLNESKPEIQDAYTDYLTFASISLLQASKLVEDILEKYPDYRKEIQEGLSDPIDELMQEEKEIRAQLEHISGNLDLRNKARDFKKIKALLLEKIEFNIAKVAQLIHVSPKHLSANVMRNEQDDLMEKAKWFDVIDVKCSCGKENNLDIADWFNKQVERMALSLPYQKPNITHKIN